MKYLLPLSLFLLALNPLFAQKPDAANQFLYVAHRGASYLAPENTLASINLAWELGADAAECDVMLTSDNRVILFHDKNARKLTGQNLEIRNTSWDQLRGLTIRLKEHNEDQYAEEPIPLLSDVLSTVPEDRMLVIEIKTGPEILPYLKEVVDRHWTSGRISFIAFDLETILATKKLYPEVPCYYLSMLGPELNRNFDKILAGKLDGVDLRHGMIDKKLARKCLEAGLDLWCWTVNDPETALRMKELGVTAITTDRPAWLKQQLGHLN